MKTVLISQDGRVPRGLRAIVERGSTVLVEYRADELPGSAHLDADRVVFWGEGDQPDLRTLAEACLRDAPAELREGILYVTGATETSRPGMAADQVFAWPRDEDRLKVVFMTGA